MELGLSATEALLYILLAALTYITIHRKELSTNHSSRRPTATHTSGQHEEELLKAASTIATELYSESVTIAATAYSSTTSYLASAAQNEAAELLPPSQNPPHSHSPVRNTAKRSYSTDGELLGPLSQDNLVDILSFLTPRDVVQVRRAERARNDAS